MISASNPVTHKKLNSRTFMLGEKIGEISGKVNMQRVVPNLGGDPKMETSFQATGSVLGANIKDTGTYTTIFRPDGTQYGEGQGIMITKDGKTATWTGHGVGTMHQDGTATYRGALYFQTMPPKWSRLNKVAVLFEYAIDAEGNMHSEYWEWK
jgi:DNA-binding transcriptional regulator LsrR (DeoR family)